MKKIVIWEIYSIIGGGQRVSLDILDALKDNYKCIFFVPGEGPLTEGLNKRNTEHKVLPIGSYSDGKKGLKDIIKMSYHFPRVFKKAYWFIKKNNIELIYSNASRSFIWSAIIGRLLSIPVIWHMHIFIVDKKAELVFNLLGRLKSVKKIIFVSNSLREQFPKLHYKSETIYNGLNINRFRDRSSDLDIREEFGISQPMKIVSTISWISKEKRIEVFIKAIPHILRKHKDVHFLVVGDIQEGHEPYHAFLKKLAEELKVTKNITFTGHCDNIPGLLKDIYINCITSLESYALVIPEGYVFGVPAIGPDRGGPFELIKDDETGLIYKFNDEKDLAKKIILLLNDEGLRRELNSNCKSYVNRFHISRFSEKINKLVKNTLNEDRPNP